MQQHKRVANQLECRQAWPLARAGGETRRFSRPAVHRRAPQSEARRRWQSSRDGSSREQPNNSSSWSQWNAYEHGRYFPTRNEVMWQVIKAIRRTGIGRRAETHLNGGDGDESGCTTTSSQARPWRNRRTRANEESVGVGIGGSDSLNCEEWWIRERCHNGVLVFPTSTH